MLRFALPLTAGVHVQRQPGRGTSGQAEPEGLAGDGDTIRPPDLTCPFDEFISMIHAGLTTG